MKTIKDFFQKLQVAFCLLFSKNYVVVVMGKKSTYAMARSESVYHLDELNDLLELTMDDAESFYDFENQMNDYSHLN